MFEREAFYELENAIKQLYKDGVWKSLDKPIRQYYANSLKYWQRRLPIYVDEDEEKKDNANKEIDYQTNANSKNKKHNRKKYYGHPVSLDKAAGELGLMPADLFSPEDYVVRKELHQALYTAIDGLEEDMKAIIILLYFEEKSEDDTAAELGLTKSKVHYQKGRIIKILQEFLKDFR